MIFLSFSRQLNLIRQEFLTLRAKIPFRSDGWDNSHNTIKVSYFPCFGGGEQKQQK